MKNNCYIYLTTERSRMKQLLTLIATLSSLTFAKTDCEDILRSSYINIVCYDESSHSMWVQLNTSWYKYHKVSNSEYIDIVSALNIDKYFNSVKGHYKFTKESP